MKTVKGNKLLEITKEELDQLKSKYARVELDLGTGDGRFVYKRALAMPTTLYIGVDPAAKQMEEFSKKAVKNHVDNVIYVIGSVEILPQELIGAADYLTVILPWGSLLEAIANVNITKVNNLRSLMKPDAGFTFILGYSEELEKGETKRLQLPELNEVYIKTQLIPQLQVLGFSDAQAGILNKSELADLDSTWGKRIKATRNRILFKIDKAL